MATLARPWIMATLARPWIVFLTCLFCDFLFYYFMLSIVGCHGNVLILNWICEINLPMEC